ncbi:MAG: CPBP family glutamic-type intramembrane protease [Propionibacteriaceae bacterium]|nr:CPBP family glutamic-type intramembrane protease [Propionibacteriaceae bacterium]
MSYPAYGTSPTGAQLSSYPGPAPQYPGPAPQYPGSAPQYPGGYGSSGKPNPVKLFTPTQLKDSMRFFQVPARKWWWGLICLAVFLVLFYGMQVAVGVGVGLARPPWTDALLHGITTPATFLLNNLVIAGVIPVAIVVSWLFYRQGFGWLSSVVGRFRWKWMLIPLGIFVAGYVVETVIEIILTGPTDYGLHDLQFKSYTWFMIIAILLTTPFQCAGEEFMARGLLPRLVTAIIPFRWVGLALSALIPSAFFMYLHDAQDPWLNANYFCVALLMWWLAYRTGGIEASIALHIVNNIFSEWTLPFTDFSGLMDRSDGSSGPQVFAYLLVQLLLVVLVDIIARRRGLVRLASPCAVTPQVVKPTGWVTRLAQAAQAATKADLPRIESTVREEHSQYSWMSAVPTPQRNHIYVPPGYLPYDQSPSAPPLPGTAPASSSGTHGPLVTPTPAHLLYGTPVSSSPVNPSWGSPGSPPSGGPSPWLSDSSSSLNPAAGLSVSPSVPLTPTTARPPAPPPSPLAPPSPLTPPNLLTPSNPLTPPASSLPPFASMPPASPVPPTLPTAPTLLSPPVPPTSPVPPTLPTAPTSPTLPSPPVPARGWPSEGSDPHQPSWDTDPRRASSFTPPTGSPAVFSAWVEAPTGQSPSTDSAAVRSPLDSGADESEPIPTQVEPEPKPRRPVGPPPWPVTLKTPGLAPMSSPFSEKPPFTQPESPRNEPLP